MRRIPICDSEIPRAVLVLTLLATQAPALGRAAEGSPVRLSLGEYASKAGLDVVVARVVAVSDSQATIGDPPRVTLDVRRVLRSHLRTGSLRALWEIEEPSFRCGNETESESRGWERHLATPARGPAVGARMLICGSRGNDGLWRTFPDFRFPDSDTLRRVLLRDLTRADARREKAAGRERRERQTQHAEDERRRWSANLEGLVRSSTDVVVARRNPDSEDLQILSYLYKAPEDSVAARVRTLWSYSHLPGARLRLSFEPPQGPTSRLWAGEDLQPGRRSKEGKAYLCFLRRRAYAPYDGGYWPVVPSDPATGILPADSTVVREVRRIVRRESRNGPWTASPPAECGASWRSFGELGDSDWKSVHVRIMKVLSGPYVDSRHAFVFGTELRDQDRPYLPLCDACGECVWSEDGSLVYPVCLPRESLAEWTRALADMEEGAALTPADSAVAILTIRGQLGGRMRSGERRLSRVSLAQATEALAHSVTADSLATWRVNYLKYTFAPLLAPEPGWHLMR